MTVDWTTFNPATYDLLAAPDADLRELAMAVDGGAYDADANPLGLLDNHVEVFPFVVQLIGELGGRGATQMATHLQSVLDCQAAQTAAEAARDDAQAARDDAQAAAAAAVREIPAWDQAATYALGDLVYTGSPGVEYRSLQGGNTGHDPATATAWWEPREPRSPMPQITAPAQVLEGGEAEAVIDNYDAAYTYTVTVNGDGALVSVDGATITFSGAQVGQAGGELQITITAARLGEDVSPAAVATVEVVNVPIIPDDVVAFLSEDLSAGGPGVVSAGRDQGAGESDWLDLAPAVTVRNLVAGDIDPSTTADELVISGVDIVAGDYILAGPAGGALVQGPVETVTDVMGPHDSDVVQFDVWDATDKLSRTTVDGNKRVMTFACWVKTPNNGNDAQTLFQVRIPATSRHFNCYLYYNGTVGFSHDYDGSNYEDDRPLAGSWSANTWFHFVCAIDKNQVDAADGMKIWINGVEVPGTASPWTPGVDSAIFGVSGNEMTVGTGAWNSIQAGGRLADVHFIDGQFLTPADFNYPNTQLADVDYGPNGFFLPFLDAGNLGLDSSGKGNHFTATSDISHVTDDNPTTYGTSIVGKNADITALGLGTAPTAAYYIGTEALAISSATGAEGAAFDPATDFIHTHALESITDLGGGQVLLSGAQVTPAAPFRRLAVAVSHDTPADVTANVIVRKEEI